MLEVQELKKDYLIPQSFQQPLKLQALRGVNFRLEPGKTLAIVGESGCGKSTLAKIIIGLEPASEGNVFWQGGNLFSLPQGQRAQIVQMVFQDPNSSLNPRKKIFDIIAEPLKVRGLPLDQIRKRVEHTAEEVGLRLEWLNRYPHMLSGGQKQRIGIARALVADAKVLICDEPVSALDVSVQAQVLNLLLDLQQKHGLSYLFISHDLGVIEFIADDVAVLYLGKIVELGSKKQIFANAKHPYTQLLLKTMPRIGQDFSFEENPAELPSPLKPPSGCAFQSRCPKASDLCQKVDPVLQDHKTSWVACHHA